MAGWSGHTSTRLRRRAILAAVAALLTSRGGLAAVLALAALAIGAGSASAATKDFSATIAPSSVLAGRVVAIDATLKNRTAQQQLGSANITPPPNYTVVSIVSLLRPAPATATIVGGVVQLRELSLPPQASVTVSLRVDTPCLSGATSQWGFDAKQANDFSALSGNALTLDGPTSSVTTTTFGACTPCPEKTSCTANLGVPAGSQTSVTSDPNPTQPDVGRLAISVTGALQCADYTGRSQNAFNMDAPQNRPKRAVLTFPSSPRPVTSQDPLDVCYASPTQFAIKPKTTPQQPVVIDGVLNYVGRLPNCLGFSVPPCVTGRDNALLSISFTMPTGDPRYG